MDLCPFVRILVGNLALNVPTRSLLLGIHDPCFSCHCKIKLTYFPHQVATIPLIRLGRDIGGHSPENVPVAACFSLSKSQICLWGSSYKLSIEVYADGNGCGACGLASGKLLGKVSVPLDLQGAESRPCVLHNGSVPIGRRRIGKSRSCMQLCLTFGTEPDQSAVLRSRNWLSCLKPGRDKFSREQKGWSITIHDLSGSPVAMASMVTPFLPSPGSDRVSRSNPGAWLILRPGFGTWKPWGRHEAWCEPGFTDALGYRVDIFHDNITTTVASSTLSTQLGGKFTMDITTTNIATPTQTPLISPQSSSNFGSAGSRSVSRPVSGSGSDFGFGVLSISPRSSSGFVMSSTVEGAG
ncbi:Erg28 like protein [Hibiscus syriacus]|uniref:Erg28 like protein n=1 Tax=Hibiscus syriacus TaxID=106335 RepID=A0A6A3B4J3_HIBSY|nr:Erg28 like protein [Hibiscus syriacus]